MEQDDGFGVFVWGVPEVGEVALGADDGTFLRAGLMVGGMGSPAEFALDFVLVGPDPFHDLVSGQEWDEAFCQ